MRYRITLRGVGVELRGYVDEQANMEAIAKAVDPLGLLVLASPMPDDFDPFTLETEALRLVRDAIDNVDDVVLGSSTFAVAAREGARAALRQVVIDDLRGGTRQEASNG